MRSNHEVRRRQTGRTRAPSSPTSPEDLSGSASSPSPADVRGRPEAVPGPDRRPRSPVPSTASSSSLRHPAVRRGPARAVDHGRRQPGAAQHPRPLRREATPRTLAARRHRRRGLVSRSDVKADVVALAQTAARRGPPAAGWLRRGATASVLRADDPAALTRLFAERGRGPSPTRCSSPSARAAQELAHAHEGNARPSPSRSTASRTFSDEAFVTIHRGRGRRCADRLLPRRVHRTGLPWPTPARPGVTRRLDARSASPQFGLAVAGHASLVAVRRVARTEAADAIDRRHRGLHPQAGARQAGAECRPRGGAPVRLVSAKVGRGSPRASLEGQRGSSRPALADRLDAAGESP